METIKMGKRGTIVIPAKLRDMFGLTDGSLLAMEVKEGEINLRPASASTGETWTRERTAYFMLINSVTKEEWDRMVPEVVAMGLDPLKIEGIDPNHRESLPTIAEWNQNIQSAKKAFAEEGTLVA